MTSNQKLNNWVNEMSALCEPDEIRWCNGSREEYDEMFALMMASGTAQKLDEKLRPNSYLVRSDPADVARVEDRTFICSKNELDAGPNNNWGRPGRNACQAHGAVPRFNEGAHDVCRPL